MIPLTVAQARDALGAAIDAVTTEITFPGELDAVDDALDAYTAAVRAEEQAKREALVRELAEERADAEQEFVVTGQIVERAERAERERETLVTALRAIAGHQCNCCAGDCQCGGAYEFIAQTALAEKGTR